MERSQGCMECTARSKHMFCSMQNSSLEKFDSIGTPVRFGSGAIIFREGDNCGSVHVLCSGRVKLSATSREGRTLILKIARAGEVLGLSAALAGQPFEVTAETVEPVSYTHLKFRSTRRSRSGRRRRRPGIGWRSTICRRRARCGRSWTRGARLAWGRPARITGGVLLQK